jgi:hypothetical protein
MGTVIGLKGRFGLDLLQGSGYDRVLGEALQVDEVSTVASNPHTFRRTFACLLRKAGVDSLTIKDLGRWESLEMVQRYTRPVTFEDSLKHYGVAVGWQFRLGSGDHLGGENRSGAGEEIRTPGLLLGKQIPLSGVAQIREP